MGHNCPMAGFPSTVLVCLVTQGIQSCGFADGAKKDSVKWNNNYISWKKRSEKQTGNEEKGQ